MSKVECSLSKFVNQQNQKIDKEIQTENNYYVRKFKRQNKKQLHILQQQVDEHYVEKNLSIEYVEKWVELSLQTEVEEEDLQVIMNENRKRLSNTISTPEHELQIETPEISHEIMVIENNFSTDKSNENSMLQEKNENRVKGRKRNKVEGRKRKARFYTDGEDKIILTYLIKNNLESSTTGNLCWQNMERNKIVKDRTWQSLKNRFHRVLIHNKHIYKYMSHEKATEFMDKMKGVNTLYQKRKEKQPSECSSQFHDERINQSTEKLITTSHNARTAENKAVLNNIRSFHKNITNDESDVTVRTVENNNQIISRKEKEDIVKSENINLVEPSVKEKHIKNFNVNNQKKSKPKKLSIENNTELHARTEKEKNKKLVTRNKKLLNKSINVEGKLKKYQTLLQSITNKYVQFCEIETGHDKWKQFAVAVKPYICYFQELEVLDSVEEYDEVENTNSESANQLDGSHDQSSSDDEEVQIVEKDSIENSKMNAEPSTYKDVYKKRKLFNLT